MKWLVDKKNGQNEKEKEDADANGVLYSSGLIAGEGLVGISLAILAIIPAGKGKTAGDVVGGWLPGLMPALADANVGNLLGLAAFALLALSLWRACCRKGS